MGNIAAIPIQETTKYCDESQNYCEYKGILYCISTDFGTKKDFIMVDGKKLFLDRNGNVQSKQPGQYSTVDFLTKEECEKMHWALLKAIKEATTPTNELMAWRNYTIFFCGINVGLRASDLRKLKWSDVFYRSWEPKKGWIFESKKTHKRTVISFNKMFIEGMENFRNRVFDLRDDPDYEDYIFFSKKNYDKPIDTDRFWRIMNDAAVTAGIDKNIGSHSLRKTFGRNAYLNAEDKTHALVVLQEWFRHSSQAMTLRYIGITYDEMKELSDGLDYGFAFGVE